MAEREGFEPSVEVSPYGSLANCCLRPLGHLSTGLSSMRGSQSSATQVDDRWKTTKGAVILPQAIWEVQAVGEVDEEKESGGDGTAHRSTCLAHRNRIGFFASSRMADERLRPHCDVCFMLSVMLWSHDCNGTGWVRGCPVVTDFPREAVMMLTIGAS